MQRGDRRAELRRRRALRGPAAPGPAGVRPGEGDSRRADPARADRRRGAARRHPGRRSARHGGLAGLLEQAGRRPALDPSVLAPSQGGPPAGVDDAVAGRRPGHRRHGGADRGRHRSSVCSPRWTRPTCCWSRPACRPRSSWTPHRRQLRRRRCARSTCCPPLRAGRGGVPGPARAGRRASWPTGEPAPTPRPGMSAVAHLRVREAADAVTVPAAAVFTADGRDAVWVVRDGKADRAPVTVGVQGQDLVQILNGVQPGDGSWCAAPTRSATARKSGDRTRRRGSARRPAGRGAGSGHRGGGRDPDVRAGRGVGAGAARGVADRRSRATTWPSSGRPARASRR